MSRPARHGEQHPDRIDRALAADDEEGVFLEPAGHRRNNGVDGEAEGEQNRESADIFHCELVLSPRNGSASRTSLGWLLAWLRQARARLHLGLGFVLGRAFRLHFAGMKDAVLT